MEVVFDNVTYKRKKFSLQNLSFRIREGYITALIGKNGAGKTTLFHLLLDKGIQYEGKILADGTEWKQNHTERMNQIGFVSDENKFFMERTALENAVMLQWVFDEKPEGFSVNTFEISMEQMGLSVHKHLKDMSRGEYIKFQLAFAIAHHAKLFLLDEATAGMDPIFKKEFFQMLHRLLEDECCSVLISTHIEEDIERHMDYIVQIECGKIVLEREAGMR